MTLANILTIFRIAFIPVFIIAVVYGRPHLALLVFLIAGITDILDGFIARFFNQKTPLGAILDPMADKLMLTSAFVTLAIRDTGLTYTMPLWVPVLTIARDVIISLLSLVLSLYFGVRNFPPSFLGKCTTFCQISYVVAVLLLNAYGFPLEVVLIFMWAVAFFTVASGLHYLWRAKAMTREFA
jgi:cardiolipin synthase (CMP-forming)